MATNSASGHGKTVNPFGSPKSPRLPKESNKSNSSKTESPKSKGRWLVVAGLIVVVGFLAAVIAYLLVAPSTTLGRNNFTVETHDGETYYVMHGSYSGEYDVQYVNLNEEFSDESESLDTEFVDSFETMAVMDYSEYADFCNQWHLGKKYANRNLDYLVVAQVARNAVTVSADLTGIEYNEGMANLYIWDDAEGVTADMASYMLVVPVERGSVQNVNAMEAISSDEWSEIQNPDPAGHTYEVSLKPIIYLYPTSEAKASVRLGKPNDVTVSYPEYNASKGWNVLAQPDGDLVDLDTGRNLYSLYYESVSSEDVYSMQSDGFIVSREDTVSFLEDKLARLGLNEHEAEEFIVYWLPKLQQNNYNYIRFATMDEINNAMPLDINPNPDTVIRVLMTFKGLDKPIEGITEQQLPTTPTRDGFTVVEWGGSELED